MMNLKSHPMKLTLAVLAIAMAGSVALTAQAGPMGDMHHGHRGHMGAEGPRGGMRQRMLDASRPRPSSAPRSARSWTPPADLQAQRESGRALREQSRSSSRSRTSTPTRPRRCASSSWPSTTRPASA
jgi:hypothetical protein